CSAAVLPYEALHSCKQTEWRGFCKTGKKISRVAHPEPAGHQFSENGAEVSGNGQVRTAVQLFRGQARPFAVNLATQNPSAHDHHDVAVAVVSSFALVSLQPSAEFAHDDDIQPLMVA